MSSDGRAEKVGVTVKIEFNAREVYVTGLSSTKATLLSIILLGYCAAGWCVTEADQTDLVLRAR